MFLNARRGLAIVASAALLTAVAACKSDNGTNPPAKAQVPGVTANSILVGTHQPLTGPAAAGYSKISPATKAYFDYINSKGGVFGRKITYKIMDDGYNPANTQTVVRQLVQQDKVFAILNGLGTPTHTGVLDFLKANKVPDLFVASGSRSWDNVAKYPGTFAFQPDYTTEGKIQGSYVKSNFAGQKVCAFIQGDDFGTDYLTGVEKGLGASVLAKQTYTVANTNVAPQMGELKKAGCQVVMLATIPGFTALALGTSAQIGFKPQWLASSVGGDYRTVASYLKDAAGPLLNGFITDGYLPSNTDLTDPWNMYFEQINKNFNNDAPFDGNIVYGMSLGYLFVQALQAAGPDLTRDGLIAAVEKGGFTGPGLAPLLFSKTTHAGYGGERMAKVTGTTQAYFGPVYVTDKADAPVTEYSGTPAAPPAY